MPGVSSKEIAMTQPIVPCLWFDGNAEEAANYYVRNETPRTRSSGVYHPPSVEFGQPRTTR
jgi:hypothetical protein